jgi:DNA-binding transcriptional LysR family regulator
MRNVRQPCGGHVLVVRIAIERSRSGAASKSRLNVNTAEAAIDAAIAGIGITHVLSYQVAQAISEGKLRIVLTDYGPNQCPCIWFMPVKVFCF